MRSHSAGLFHLRISAIWITFCVATGFLPAGTALAKAGSFSNGCAEDQIDVLIALDIGTSIRKLREELDAPGLSAAIILGDSCVYRNAVGHADREAETPLKAEDKLLAASIGKTFVAAIAIQMAVRRELDLDEPVAKWLSKYRWFRRLPNAEHLSMRMLLNHSTGILNHVGDEQFQADIRSGIRADPDFAPPHEALVQYVLDKDPIAPAGLTYHYSDTNYILAGLVIEAAASDTYYNVVQQSFVAPLHLSETVPSNNRRIEGLVPGYWDSETDYFGTGGLKSVDQTGALKFNPAIEWTGGGLASTPADLARWIRMLATGTAMNETYLDELFVSAPRRSDDGGRYGLGIEISQTNYGKVFGHSGSIPGYTSFAGYMPDAEIGFSIMINHTRPIISPAINFGESLAAELEVNRRLSQ